MCICAICEWKEKQQWTAFFVKFATYIMLMSIQVRSKQPIVEALS